MTIVLLIILLLVTVAMVAVILMQRSEGGALGIGGGGPGGMMSGASAANLLTRSTMILGIIFMGTCIVLAILSGADTRNQSIIEQTTEESGGMFDFEALDEIPADETPSDDAPSDDTPSDEPPADEPSLVPGAESEASWPRKRLRNSLLSDLATLFQRAILR
jgi:preprotein translocase subunit SecG